MSKKSSRFITLYIIAGAIIMGQVMVFIVLYFITDFASPIVDSDLALILKIVVPAYLFSMIFFSKLLYKSRIGKAADLQTNQKLNHYQQNVIIRLAMLESSALISAVIMFVTADHFFAIYFFLALFVSVIGFPTKERFIIDYALSSQDAQNVRGMT